MDELMASDALQSLHDVAPQWFVTYEAQCKAEKVGEPETVLSFSSNLGFTIFAVG